MAQSVPRSSPCILTSLVWVRIPLDARRICLDDKGTARARNHHGLTWNSKRELAFEFEEGMGRRAMGDAAYQAPFLELFLISITMYRLLFDFDKKKLVGMQSDQIAI